MPGHPDGADVAELDHDGRTPLYRASVGGRAEVVRVLLAAGADPDAGRDRVRSPLRAASYHGHHDCVAALLEAGADVDLRTDRKVTALHLASLLRRLEVMPQLLKAGAPVDARDADGRTTLIWAYRTKSRSGKATRRRAEAVDLLLAAGADPLATDQRGQSVLLSLAWEIETLAFRRRLQHDLASNSDAVVGLELGSCRESSGIGCYSTFARPVQETAFGVPSVFKKRVEGEMKDFSPPRVGPLEPSFARNRT